MTAANPIASAAIAAYTAAYNKAPNPDLLPPSQFKVPGGLTFASSSNPDIYHTQSHIFSPRFGFAWTPSKLGNKTVIRGGAGVFVFPIGVAGINQQGFSQQTSLVGSLDSFLTPSATLSNPPPKQSVEVPIRSSLPHQIKVGVRTGDGFHQRTRARSILQSDDPDSGCLGRSGGGDRSGVVWSAKKRIEQLARFLERDHEQAAKCLCEGVKEMFTLQRLNIPPSLWKCLGSAPKDVLSCNV